MTYSDYPECLPRYAWLVKEAQRTPAALFNDTARPSCKACGELVPRDQWHAHAERHALELDQPRAAARAAAADRLRAMNAARAAAPFVPMTLDDLARETR